MKRWLILVSILLPMSTFVSANSSDEIQQLEMKVEQLRVEAERAELNYLEAKNKLEQLKKRSQTSRKVGERTGDKPCTCVLITNVCGIQRKFSGIISSINVVIIWKMGHVNMSRK